MKQSAFLMGKYWSGFDQKWLWPPWSQVDWRNEWRTKLIFCMLMEIQLL